MTDLTNDLTPTALVKILKEDGYRNYEQLAYDFFVTLKAAGYKIIPCEYSVDMVKEK